MTHVDVSRRTEVRRPQKAPKADPAEFLVAIIKKMPRAGRAAHIAAFNLATAESPELTDRIKAEWVAIKYNTLLRLAHPRSTAELMRGAAERAQVAERIKGALARGVWAFVMPNGRPLHECRFSYIAQQGQHFTAIGMLGKGHMTARLDSVFNSPATLESALAKAGGNA